MQQPLELEQQQVQQLLELEQQQVQQLVEPEQQQVQLEPERTPLEQQHLCRQLSGQNPLYQSCK